VKIGRNDLCYCGSGIKFKRCHGNESVNAENSLDRERQNYLNKWKYSSEDLNTQDCYLWMSNLLKLENPRRVFDVGCGSGNGIMSLISTLNDDDLKIISMDENVRCLMHTKEKLEKNGIDVDLIKRFDENVNGKFHELIYSNQEIQPSKMVTLIGSDILTDITLVEKLKKLPKFDAVTVWLIGTHNERQFCNNLRRFKISDSREYRLRVQNTVYEIADEILKNNGVLQIVDRSQPLIEEWMYNDVFELHKEQASVTDLVVEKIHWKEYSEHDANRGVKMVFHDPQNLKTSRKAIVSVLSRKICT
jgi:SAM-dependent methyltransferase